MGTFVHGHTSLFTLTTPLGADKLLLNGFRGSEGISRLFRFELDLLAPDTSIDYTQIIGKSVTISITQAGGTPRYLSGVISRFGQAGAGNTFTSYYAEMVPWLWFLTRTANCKIFQNMTIPDIIKQVFGAYSPNDFTNSLKGTYAKREYCVQYRETDFNFVSRLMEEYGIYYFFQHAQGKHTLVLADDPSANVDCPGQNEFRFDTESTANVEDDVVTGWQVEQELRTGKYTLTDYNFETPSTSLLANTTTIDSVGGNTKYETFDYPGKYLTKGDGSSLVKIRMEEEEAVHWVVHGTSNARSMVSGYKFTLTEHYRHDMNQSYLLTDIQHSGSTDTYGTSKSLQGDRYSNSFRCIPASVTYRPLRLTPRPTVMGPQTAVVVGTKGEEIYVDKYGRVKVQFYWDRLGKNDDNSSCWIRVSQAWAGKNWGAVFHPRIGQEVIVDFLEGDPDQPLITGRVYNAEQMPPYDLPANMTESGILTRSSKDGSTENFNEISFEDKKGSELLYIRAEKDMIHSVENDYSYWVGHDQTITVDNDRNETVTNGNETVEIKQGNRSHTITTGDETLTVKTGNRVVEVDTGNDTHTVKTGNRSVEVNTGNDDHKVDMGNRSATISMGNDSLTVSLGNHSITVSVGSSSISALQGITLTSGPSSISIGPSGVTISAPMVTISADGVCQVSADGMLQAQGSVTMINS